MEMCHEGEGRCAMRERGDEGEGPGDEGEGR